MGYWALLGAVAAGGALGAAGRFALVSAVTRALGHGFPVGTLLVNVVGSLAIGVFIGAMARYALGGEMLRAFVAVGILGGFTTFSAFSLDVVTLIERGAWTSALLYIGISVFLSILAVFAGLALMRLV